MLAPKAAGKASMFPWMFRMIVSIIPPVIMSNPVTVRVNVGSFRMARPIGKGSAFWHIRLDLWLLLHLSLLLPWLLLQWNRLGTMSGNMSTAYVTMLPAVTLRVGGN